MGNGSGRARDMSSVAFAKRKDCGGMRTDPLVPTLLLEWLKF